MALSVTPLPDISRLARQARWRLTVNTSWSVARCARLRLVRPVSPGSEVTSSWVSWRQLVISPYWDRQYHSLLLEHQTMTMSMRV